MSEIRVPTLGESVTEATVATWFKKPGDTVAVDEMLCELETDKAQRSASTPFSRRSPRVAPPRPPKPKPRQNPPQSLPLKRPPLAVVTASTSWSQPWAKA